MKFKKLILIPVVFISVLISTLCMSAYASGDYEVIGGGNNVYYPLTDCISNYAPEYAHSYFYINYETTFEDDGVIYHKPCTMFIPIRDNATYTNNNGIITVPCEYLNPAYYYDFEYWTRLDGSFYSQDGPAFMLDGYSFSTDLVFNENLTQISFNGMTLTNTQIVAAEYDFADIHNKRTSVSVVFSPQLVGDVDRNITSGDNTSKIENIHVSVINRGNTNIQYKLSIFEKNSSAAARNGSTNSDTYYSDDPIFVLYKNEWVWGEQTEEMQNASNNIDIYAPMRYQKPSEWHFVAAGQTDTYSIKFSQIHFKQGVEYTVVVDVVDCPYTDVSSIPSTSRADFGQIDFSSAQTVYRSDFRILQYGANEYNPDDESGGVLAYDGYTGNGQAKEYSGSYLAFDAGDGTVQFENHKGDSGSSFGDNFFSGSNSQNNNTKYNTVLSQSTSVLSFFGTVLGFFPSDVFVIFNIALWLALIIFVVRRLK